MSGSGGGGGGGFDRVPENCETIVINTQLTSPKDEVIEHIDVGDVLDVEIVQQNDRAIVAVLHQGNVAGGLATTQLQRLRECIQQNVQYQAIVTQKQDGQVSVRISRKVLT